MATVVYKIKEKINAVQASVETVIKKLQILSETVSGITAIETGSATINDTYSYSGGTAKVVWVRIGKLVIVNLYDIIMMTAVTTSADCVIASGLPKAAQNAYANISSNTSLENPKRIWISSGDTNICWCWNYPVSSNSQPNTGQLIYIAED